MSIELDGFEELLTTLDSLGDIGKKITTSSVRRAMKPGLEIIRKEAPYDTENSRNALDIDKVKRYSSGSVWGGMGITSKNWEQTKALFFHQYGYHNKGLGNRYNGMFMDMHIGWFDKAYEKAKNPILNELESEIGKEIDKIL